MSTPASTASARRTNGRWMSPPTCERTAGVRGIGKRLYEELFRQLVELGYYQAFAGIALPNQASVGLHESVGFQALGVYRKVGFKNGALRDVVWWQKELQPPSATPETPRQPS